jgi:hypothetical protein
MGLLHTLTHLAGFSTDFRIVNYNRSYNREWWAGYDKIDTNTIHSVKSFVEEIF